MRVAVCQLNARDDRAENLRVARGLLERAAAGGADLAVLPEYVDYLGRADGSPKPEPIDGEFATFFADAARELGIWVHAGSFHEVGPDAEHTFNTTLVFDRQGALAGTYRKIHLYDVEIPGRVSYHESATVAPGTQTALLPSTTRWWACRSATTSAFRSCTGSSRSTGPPCWWCRRRSCCAPGRDHWEPLLRARAIENQCYVLAAGQVGNHDPDRTCFGRSMVIDPWGTVVALAPDVVGVTFADLDFERLAEIRATLPSLANRRL